MMALLCSRRTTLSGDAPAHLIKDLSSDRSSEIHGIRVETRTG